MRESLGGIGEDDATSRKILWKSVCGRRSSSSSSERSPSSAAVLDFEHLPDNGVSQSPHSPSSKETAWSDAALTAPFSSHPKQTQTHPRICFATLPSSLPPPSQLYWQPPPRNPRPPPLGQPPKSSACSSSRRLHLLFRKVGNGADMQSIFGSACAGGSLRV